MVLHRVPFVHRLSDRRGHSRFRSQAGASGGRITGRCAAENAGGDGADDRAFAGCGRYRGGESDGRLDW